MNHELNESKVNAALEQSDAQTTALPWETPVVRESSVNCLTQAAFIGAGTDYSFYS